MTDHDLPERVNGRKVTEGNHGGKVTIGIADLGIIGATEGDDIKVLTYDDRIVIRPAEDI